MRILQATLNSQNANPNTVANARTLLDTHVRPELGRLRVDRTKTDRIEQVFLENEPVAPQLDSDS